MVVVSSANCVNLRRFDEYFISLTYSKNNSGPKVDPCGTPFVTDFMIDLKPLTLTNIYALL